MLHEKHMPNEKSSPVEKAKPVEKVDSLQKIEELLEQNLELSQKIFESSEKVRRYMMWNRIWGITKMVLIIVPLIAFLIIVPPMLQNVFKQYGGALQQIDDLKKGGLTDIDSQMIQDFLKR